MNREERVNTLMSGALEGVQVPGRGLLVGGSEQTLDAMSTAGLSVERWDRYGRNATRLPPEGSFDRIAVRLPKGRSALNAALHVVSAQLADGGSVWLYGSNDEGIKSADKTLKTLFSEVEKVDSRKHSRLWQATGVHTDLRKLSDFEQQVNVEVAGKTLSFRTLPGVFADGRVDDGTAVLLKHMKVDEGKRVLDFGCGAGVIGLYLKGTTDSIVGYDHDAWAIDCARANAPGEYRGCSGWADVEGTYDHIISNPPFHTGKDQDFQVMDDLIRGAPAHLSRKGQLTIVCPSTAGVHRALSTTFKTVNCVHDDTRYRVWHASR